MSIGGELKQGLSTIDKTEHNTRHVIADNESRKKEALIRKGKEKYDEKAVFKGNQYTAPLSTIDNEPKHNTRQVLFLSHVILWVLPLWHYPHIDYR